MRYIMQQISERIHNLVDALPPITLDEMKSIRLMNRTDQKYLTNLSTLAELLKLTAGAYRAQVVNGKRICAYATTYFDTFGPHSMFRQHETGHKPRTKVRVRTYLESDITFLEVKKKDNHGKTSKMRISVPSLDSVVTDHVGADFIQQTAGLDLTALHPAVSNRFSRITLVNLQKTERLTIDFDLHFLSHSTQERSQMDNVVVIELKRIGASVTGDQQRINRFKKRLVKIRKVAEKE